MTRTITARFRLTPEEHTQLQRRAHQAKTTLSDYIRSRIIEPPVATPRLCPRCTRIGIPACSACQASFKNGK